MSLLQYTPPGGTAIALNLIKVHNWTREHVFAPNNNYLYTRHKLVVRAIFNPATQTGTLAGQGISTIGAGGRLVSGGAPIPFVPPPVPNVQGAPVGPVIGQTVGLGAIGGGAPGGRTIPAAVSEAALRHDLSQPRGQLVYSISGQPVLVSPLPGFTTDCTNGPVPFYFNVVDIKGPRTFVVDYGIQTDVNESILRSTPNHYLLSHNWSQEHLLDEDYFVAVVTRGQVVFRADVLANGLGFVPDDFRKLIFHPIPSNMKREKVQVRALPDGVTYEYEVLDREKPLNINSNIVTRFEAVHRITVEREEREAIAAKSLFETVGDITQLMSRSDVDPVRFNAVLLAAGMRSTAGTLYSTFAAQPVAHHEVNVRVWGHRNAARRDLQVFAENLINARLASLFNLGFTFMGLRLSALHDVGNKYVERSSTFTTGPIATLRSGVAAPGTVLGAAFWPATDDTGTLVVTASRAAAALPPDDNISRGTFLENALAGALLAPNVPVLPNPVSPFRAANPPSSM